VTNKLLKSFLCRLLLVLSSMCAISYSTTSAQTDSRIQKLEQIASLISENRIAEAESKLQLTLRSAPNDSVALNLLGTIRAQQKRYKEAETLFTRAIQSDKLFVGAHLNLAYLYTITGKPEKTVAELRQVLQIDPTNVEVLDRLARLLLAEGQIDAGIKVLEEGEKAQPLSGSLLVLRGDAFLKKGVIPKAEESYQRAIAQDGENTDAVLGMAQAAQLKGDADSASALLDRSRKMVANSPETLYRFAMVAIRAGLYEEANRSLLAAIKSKSDDAAYFLALGTTWIKKPDLAEAESSFRRALQLRPNNAQAQMYLGYTLLEQKKYPEAKVWLQKSLDQDKTVPETYFYLGQIAQEQNEDLQAIDLFKQAIQLAPTYSFAHGSLGASYLRLKNYAAAQQELELSIKLNPNDAKAHYNLAVLFARLNNQKRAQEEMNIVEQLKNAGKPAKSDPTPQPD
jgi:tetratricopeptide (TPR) repeat protein